MFKKCLTSMPVDQALEGLRNRLKSYGNVPVTRRNMSATFEPIQWHLWRVVKKQTTEDSFEHHMDALNVMI